MGIAESVEASTWTTGASNLGCRLIAVVQWALWLPQPASEDKGASFSYSVRQPLAYVIWPTQRPWADGAEVD